MQEKRQRYIIEIIKKSLSTNFRLLKSNQIKPGGVRDLNSVYEKKCFGRGNFDMTLLFR